MPILVLLLVALCQFAPALAEPAPQLPVTGSDDFENYLRFDPSSRYLMLDAANGLRVWDLRNFKLLKHLKVSELLDSDVSPDGHWLAVGSRPRKVEVFDLHTGKKAWDFSGIAPGQSEGSYSVSFSRDGRYLMATGASRGREAIDMTARVWSVGDWKPVGRSAPRKEPWHDFAWTPWGEIARLDKEPRKLLLYQPVGFAARTVTLVEEAYNLKVEGDELVAYAGIDDQRIVKQRLAKGETAARVETVDEYLRLGEELRLSRAVGGLWTSFTGYGGPATLYRGEDPEEIGKLAWASGPPTPSPDGTLLAIPLRQGVLVLDVPATIREGKLIPYKGDPR